MYNCSPEFVNLKTLFTVNAFAYFIEIRKTKKDKNNSTNTWMY